MAALKNICLFLEIIFVAGFRNKCTKRAKVIAKKS